jgi:hypothetical protein
MAAMISAAVRCTSSRLSSSTAASPFHKDVIRARRSGLKADCLANHERYRLGFRLAEALRCARAALSAVKPLVG